MPIPSDATRARSWMPPPPEAARSVYGNFQEPSSAPSGSTTAGPNAQTARPALAPISPSDTPPERPLARSILYRFLAQAFEDPAAEGWEWLTRSDTRQSVIASVRYLAQGQRSRSTDAGPPPASSPDGGNEPVDLLPLTGDYFQALAGHTLPSYRSAYAQAFGHAARGPCPLNEIEFGDLGADPLIQPHRLADLAAFYHAFGLELADLATERLDHVSCELEFMCVLAAKESYLLQGHAAGPPASSLALCWEAQAKFLRQHLGRWTPAFTRRLEQSVPQGPLAVLARLTRRFVEDDCLGHHVHPGSEDLLLRPVTPSEEGLCMACGLPSQPSEPACP